MTDYRSLNHDAMFAALSKLGSDIEQYKPTQFRQTIFKTTIERLEGRESQFDAPNGYCAGVALEWIRRVLLGGIKTEQKPAYLTFGYDAIVKQIEKTPKSAKAYNKLQLMLLAWQQQEESRNKSALTGSKPYAVKHEKQDWEKVTWISDLKAKDWRGKERTRPMAKLKFKHGTEHRNVAWPMIDEQLKKVVFVQKAGSAVRLGFSKRANGRASGHSVAIWRRRTSPDMHDAYYFFDPNFGLFAYDANGLSAAVTALFGWHDDDTPRYNCTAFVGETFQRADFGVEVFGPAHCIDSYIDFSKVDLGDDELLKIDLSDLI